MVLPASDHSGAQGRLPQDTDRPLLGFSSFEASFEARGCSQHPAGGMLVWSGCPRTCGSERLTLGSAPMGGEDRITFSLLPFLLRNSPCKGVTFFFFCSTLPGSWFSLPALAEPLSPLDAAEGAPEGEGRAGRRGHPAPSDSFRGERQVGAGGTSWA